MLFGIVQSRFEDLRIKSAEELLALDFPGYAIGGVSVGETEEEMLEQVKWGTAVLPQEKPAMSWEWVRLPSFFKWSEWGQICLTV